ncbi:MAG: hypothetical protein Fues2KO_24520 [Fuerstiella sp.]
MLAGILLVPSVAEAHYLWVKIDRQAGGNGAANIFFEESAAAGDGHYLDPFLVSKTTWIRTVEDIAPKQIPLQEARAGKEKRWVVSPLPAAAPRSIDSYWLFGVYQYGQKHVLLHYYARYLDVKSHEDLHELAGADQMALDMVPHDVGNTLEIRVVWNGKPVPGRFVHVRGPKGFKHNFKTDDRGKIQFEIAAEGEYSFRTSVEKQKSGEHDGERYDSIRHNATLIMKLPLAE